MNCESFISRVRNRALGPGGGAVAEEMLGHARHCADCATIVTGEDALRLALEAVRENDRNLEAPEGLETALRAAFRERMNIREASDAARVIRPVESTQHVMKGRFAAVVALFDFRSWAGVPAAAAAMVTFLAIGGAIYWGSVSGPAAAGVASIKPVATGSNVPAPRGIEPGSSFPVIDAAPAGSRIMRPAAYNPSEVGARHAVRYSRPRRPEMGATAESDQADVQPEEISTDFMPLDGAGDLAMEGGQVVRVELPRATLSAMGLPMNLERADERVMADVVVGPDGLARAIRFVR